MQIKKKSVQKFIDMLKLFFLLFITILSLFPHLNHSECCGTTLLKFRIKNNKTCSDYDAKVVYPLPESANIKCKISVCGNGKPLQSGIYCGNGPCNIFGCNCDRGCTEGHPVTKFKKIHGNNVYNVTMEE